MIDFTNFKATKNNHFIVGATFAERQIIFKSFDVSIVLLTHDVKKLSLSNFSENSIRNLTFANGRATLNFQNYEVLSFQNSKHIK